MRNLIASEINQISGGTEWSDLQVIAVTAGTNVATVTLAHLYNQGLTNPLTLLNKALLFTIIPTVIVSGFVYGVNEYNSYQNAE